MGWALFPLESQVRDYWRVWFGEKTNTERISACFILPFAEVSASTLSDTLATNAGAQVRENCIRLSPYNRSQAPRCYDSLPGIRHSHLPVAYNTHESTVLTCNGCTLADSFFLWKHKAGFYGGETGNELLDSLLVSNAAMTPTNRANECNFVCTVCRSVSLIM